MILYIKILLLIILTSATIAILIFFYSLIKNILDD